MFLQVDNNNKEVTLLRIDQIKTIRIVEDIKNKPKFKKEDKSFYLLLNEQFVVNGFNTLDKAILFVSEKIGRIY